MRLCRSGLVIFELRFFNLLRTCGQSPFMSISFHVHSFVKICVYSTFQCTVLHWDSFWLQFSCSKMNILFSYFVLKTGGKLKHDFLLHYNDFNVLQCIRKKYKKYRKLWNIFLIFCQNMILNIFMQYFRPFTIHFSANYNLGHIHTMFKFI